MDREKMMKGRVGDKAPDKKRRSNTDKNKKHT